MSKPVPSVAVLTAWRNDDVTQWVLKQLYHRYPAPKGPFPISTPEQLAKFNYAMATKEAFEYLEKICRTGDAS